MKNLIAVLLLLSAAACATTPSRDRWLAACETRAATVRSLTVIRNAGELSADATSRVTDLVRSTQGLCSGDQPPATKAALDRLEANILQLVIIKGKENDTE